MSKHDEVCPVSTNPVPAICVCEVIAYTRAQLRAQIEERLLQVRSRLIDGLGLNDEFWHRDDVLDAVWERP